MASQKREPSGCILFISISNSNRRNNSKDSRDSNYRNTSHVEPLRHSFSAAAQMRKGHGGTIPLRSCSPTSLVNV